jgi:hypothetical protein
MRAYSGIHYNQSKIMNTHRTIRSLTTQALIALALVVRPHSIYAQAGAGEPAANTNNVVPQEKLLEDIGSTNGLVRLDAAIQLNRQRGQLIRKLLAILDSSMPDESKMDAAVILGDYGAPQAIPFLVNHSDWEVNLQTNNTARDAYFESFGGLEMFRVRSREPIGEVNVKDAMESPVTRALLMIGSRALPALLDKITQSDNERLRGTSVIICDEIEGNEVTQFRLQGLLQKETDSKKKERIQSALDILKKVWLKQ